MKSNNYQHPVLNPRSGIGLTCLLLLTLAGCDGQGGESAIVLTPGPKSSLSNEVLESRIESDSKISGAFFTPDRSQPNESMLLVNLVGLWIAGFQHDGLNANIAGLPFSGLNQFEFAQTGPEAGGLYRLSADEALQDIENWPAQDGAPSHPDGSPKMYGDQMIWGLFRPSNEPNERVHNFSGLNVGMTSFAFQEGPLEKTLFFRYDLSNASEDPVTDLHLGFGGDIDLQWLSRLNQPQACERPEVTKNQNQNGYNARKHYAFTYTKPHESDPDLAPECYGIIVGYSVLDMESASGLSQPKLAHRILKRIRRPDLFDQFNVGEIKTPTQVLFALQGLSALGEPMVNPVTGEVTPFAHTGDPVSETGWLDTRRDVRNLISIAPFDLLPGETKTMTVVVFLAQAPSFAEAVPELENAFDSIIDNRQLWDY